MSILARGPVAARVALRCGVDDDPLEVERCRSLDDLEALEALEAVDDFRCVVDGRGLTTFGRWGDCAGDRGFAGEREGIGVAGMLQTVHWATRGSNSGWRRRAFARKASGEAKRVFRMEAEAEADLAPTYIISMAHACI